MKKALLLAALLALLSPAFAGEKKKKGPTLQQQFEQAGQRVEELAKDAPKAAEKGSKSLEQQLHDAWSSFMDSMRKLKKKVLGEMTPTAVAEAPDTVEAFRKDLRARRKLHWLRGWRHFAAILLLGGSTTALSAALVKGPRWWEWASIPAGFLIANFVEWLAHRYPMHHPWRPIMIMYEKHTLEHHRFFTDAAMEAGTPDDFDMVLFSPESLAFFLLGTGLPIALLFFGLVSWNAGWIFTALAVDYYVLYECCHTAYHLPKDSWAGRLPGMAALRRHHTYHHDRSLMTDWNFNVTFPIFDRVFGTHWERRSASK